MGMHAVISDTIAADMAGGDDMSSFFGGDDGNANDNDPNGTLTSDLPAPATPQYVITNPDIPLPTTPPLAPVDTILPPPATPALDPMAPVLPPLNFPPPGLPSLITPDPLNQFSQNPYTDLIAGGAYSPPAPINPPPSYSTIDPSMQTLGDPTNPYTMSPYVSGGGVSTNTTNDTTITATINIDSMTQSFDTMSPPDPALLNATT